MSMRKTDHSAYSGPEVFRYTVDELIGEEFVRLMEARLASPDPDKLYRDDPEDWEEEEDLMVRRKDFKGLFNGQVKWQDLQEGQVYLTGYFQMEDKNGKPTGFRLSEQPAQKPGRIDALSEDEVLLMVSQLIAPKR